MFLVLRCRGPFRRRSCDGNTGLIKMQRVPVMGLPPQVRDIWRCSDPCRCASDSTCRQTGASTGNHHGSRTGPSRHRGLGLVANELRLSHAEVVARAAAPAAWLQATRHDGPFHVALMLDNVPEFIFWLEAAALAGTVVVGANPTHRGDELVRDLSHTESQFLITDSTYLPLVEGFASGRRSGRSGATTSGCSWSIPRSAGHLGAVCLGRAGGGGRPLGDARDPRLSPLHVGDLGHAEGVPVQPGPAGPASGGWSAQMYALEPADVCYLSMPLFHSNALMAGWAPALMAGSAVALPSSGRFSASGFLPDVRKAGATYFNYVESRCPSFWPRPSDPTMPTIRWCAPSATRAPPMTSPASPNVSALPSPIPTARQKEAPRCSGRRTRRRAHWVVPRGDGRARPGDRDGMPGRPLRRPRPAARRGRRHRRARVQGGRRRLRGLLAQQ